MIDLHVHTSASHDGSGSVRDFCEAAIAKGVKILGFSNHLDVDPELSHTGFYDHAEFLREVEDAKPLYGDKIKILAGVEVTYQSEHEQDLKTILDSIDADYVIGSVHSIGGADFCVSEEEGAENYFRDKMNIIDAFKPYFDEVLKAVRFGRFDIIGHIDGIRRFAPSAYGEFRPGDFYGVFRRIFDGMVKRDVALEINASGLSHEHETIYPEPSVAKLFREVGGRRFVFGSDAHRPSDLGRGWDSASEYLKGLGATFSYFEKRVPKEIAA